MSDSFNLKAEAFEAGLARFSQDMASRAANYAATREAADIALILLVDHCEAAGTLPQDDRVAVATSAARERQARRQKAAGGEHE